jgi:L-amino acid N-acyltransferase YncA
MSKMNPERAQHRAGPREKIKQLGSRMNSFVIDAMTPDDWEQVRRIYLDGLATGLASFEVDAPTWEQWDASHLPHSRLVVRAGQQILGWAALSPFSRRSCYRGVAEVSLYVAEGWRGQGIAKRLLHALIASSEQNGIWSLCGGTFAENTPSMKLQLACGFRIVGRRERIAQRHGVWHDTYLTERRSSVVAIEGCTTAVTTWYLEMTDPGQLRPRRSARPDVRVARVNVPMPELNRFFYTAVGADWFWNDRLPWTYQQWLDYLARPELETWVLSVAGVPAGYFELEAQAKGDVEVVYFGLLPPFIGQGLGAHLLTCAVERGWERGAQRVWLHTCSLDHPFAMTHYQARGFRLYHEEVAANHLSLTSPGAWPGAGRT